MQVKRHFIRDKRHFIRDKRHFICDKRHFKNEQKIRSRDPDFLKRESRKMGSGVLEFLKRESKEMQQKKERLKPLFFYSRLLP